jgi:tetratricopeptide (TPR) repeat protein
LVDRLRGRLELQRGDAGAALQSANASLAAIGGDANSKSLEGLPSLNLAAAAALAVGRSAEAQGFAQQALSMAEGVARGPDTSADVGEALLLLAKADMAQGRIAEARPLLERAARCLTNGLGAEHALTREARALQL